MIRFDLGNLKRSMSRSLRFGRLISLKTGELGHMLLSDIENHTWDAPSDFTLSDLERSKSKPLIVYHKGPG